MKSTEAAGWVQESLAILDAAVQLLHRARRGELVHCLTVLLEHKVVTRDSAYRWQWYYVIMTW